MDENSLPVSTPKSENSSPLHSSLKSSNSYNIMKSNSNLSSVKRSPLEDKNASIVTLPSITKKAILSLSDTTNSDSLSKESHFKTASPKLQKHSNSPSRPLQQQQQQTPFLTKQQQRQKKNKNTQLLLSPTKIDSNNKINNNNNQHHSNSNEIQLIYPDQLSYSPIGHKYQEERNLLLSSSSSINYDNDHNKENINDSEIIKTPITTSTTKGRNLTNQLYKEHQKELETKLKEANEEKESLRNALNKEKGKTAMLKSWCDQAITLLGQLKDLENDINDDIDIIKEYEVLVADTEMEMQQDKKIQDEIDHLMNLIPEKMLEIEDLKDSLNQ